LPLWRCHSTLPKLDDVFQSCFKRAVQQTGFDLRRVDEAPPAGLIDVRMEVEIRRSRFVVAELTHENRGVYWEAGFAEGLGKPVIYTCEEAYFEKHRSHFDTAHRHTIVWNEGKLDRAADDLKNTIGRRCRVRPRCSTTNEAHSKGLLEP
jgi:hypothetical protein